MKEGLQRETVFTLLNPNVVYRVSESRVRGKLIQFITNYEDWSKHSCVFNSNVTSAVLWSRNDDDDDDNGIDDFDDEVDDDDEDDDDYGPVRIPTLPFKGSRIESHGLIGVVLTSHGFI